ncbi:hypothetical protein [Microterricola viridarii]|uniref:Uncharacterized protein n=1 Tax=Microterricola viridarii TaxID=412690 RepID=A0A109QWL1_9MICO|nr:hypothetical protein [Microterricola viridarii]AMB58235.1 hypothetical protein AWU67_04530 [Microterricola viridarii]
MGKLKTPIYGITYPDGDAPMFELPADLATLAQTIEDALSMAAVPPRLAISNVGSTVASIPIAPAAALELPNIRIAFKLNAPTKMAFGWGGMLKASAAASTGVNVNLLLDGVLIQSYWVQCPGTDFQTWNRRAANRVVPAGDHTLTLSVQSGAGTTTHRVEGFYVEGFAVI